MWTDASVKFRYASEELMQRLQDKSKYWTDTIEWSRYEVLAKKIDFMTIENQINELLKES